MKIDLTIVGGGVVGLWTALKFAEKFPSWDIVLLEKNPFLGEEASSRNSGVLHAGLYYSTGSLKHRLCLKGAEAWKKYPQFLRMCGKYLVATNELERDALAKLRFQAHANGCSGIRDISRLELEELRESVHIKDGFFSAATGVIDVPMAIKFLAHEVESRGVVILKSHPVQSLKEEKGGFRVEGSRENFFSARLINVAGASGALAIRDFLNPPGPRFQGVWVKGHYLKLVGKPFFDKSLIYPMPPADLKSLGIHTCLWPDGSLSFGPDAFDTEIFDHKMRDGLVEQMFPSIEKVYKGVEPGELTYDFCGIRAKITRDGQPHKDFWIDSPLNNYAEAIGIESPGFTAAPAVADELMHLFVE